MERDRSFRTFNACLMDSGRAVGRGKRISMLGKITHKELRGISNGTAPKQADSKEKKATTMRSRFHSSVATARLHSEDDSIPCLHLFSARRHKPDADNPFHFAGQGGHLQRALQVSSRRPVFPEATHSPWHANHYFRARRTFNEFIQLIRAPELKFNPNKEFGKATTD